MRRIVLALLACAACGDNVQPPLNPVAKGRCPKGDSPSILVFTLEALFVHPAGPPAFDAVAQLAMRRGWRAKFTADPSEVTPDLLATTDVIVFLLTSGNILDDPSRAAMEDFFENGGGFVGTHTASITEYDWPFYKMLVPVTFKTHPLPPLNVQLGQLTIEHDDEPITADLPRPWIRSDEFYTFYERPEDLGLHLLFSLDESKMGPDYPDDVRVGYHPLAFTHEKLGGRAFYSALGHTPESWSEPLFIGVIEHAIDWAGEQRYRNRCGGR